MKIGLFNEGTYPIADGGVTRWCEQLIGSLPEFTFVPVTLIGYDEPITRALHSNVVDTTLVPMWGMTRPTIVQRHRRRLEDLLEQMWSAALPASGEVDTDPQRFAEALRALTAWSGARLARMLAAESSASALLSAWRSHRTVQDSVPALTLADAVAATAYVDRWIALADVRFPSFDVSHVAANGPSAVLALQRWWSDGTPMLLTEHGIYLRERYLALEQTHLSWAARRAVTAFLRVLCQVMYAEVGAVAPVSDFNGRWAGTLGADPNRIRTIHNGVEIDRFTVITTEPETPTVSFVGRIDPLKDLATLIQAIDFVRRQVPNVRLRLFGPVPEGNEWYYKKLERLVADLHLENTVTFEGAAPSAVPALEAGHVIALSSISEGMPFAVIEAMMAGRATVNTDVGGVGEAVGTDGRGGLLVPPRDPEAMAGALTELLLDDERRRLIGAGARERALALFKLERFTQNYRDLYLTLGGRQPEALDAGRHDNRVHAEVTHLGIHRANARSRQLAMTVPIHNEPAERPSQLA